MKKIMMTMLAMLAMTTAAMAQSTTESQCSKADTAKCSKMGKAAKTDGKMAKIDKTAMVEKRTEMMVKKYGLNTEQAAKLKVLNEKYSGMMHGPHGMKKGERPEPPQMKDGKMPEPPKEMKKGEKPEPPKEMKEYEAQLKTIMTAEQYKAYQEDMQKRMQKHSMKAGKVKVEKTEKAETTK